MEASIKRFTAAALTIMLLFVMTVTNVTAASGITVNTSKFGNIFYEDDVLEFEIDFGSLPQQGEVCCIISDFNGCVLFTQRQVVTETQVIFRPDFDKLGVFILTVEAKGVGTRSCDFSVIKRGRPNDKLGIHILFENDFYTNETIDILDVFSETGFTMRRCTDFSWDRVEKEIAPGGVFALKAQQKKELNYFAEDQKGAMAILSFGNRLYMPRSNYMPVGSTQLEKWSKYVSFLADKTKSGINYFEVWNEPNASAFNPGNATPADYVELIKASKAAVETANPGAKIMAMATSGADSNYIKSVIDAAGGGTELAKYIDGVTIHPYAWGFGPVMGETMAQVKKIRTLLDENGLSDKELWASEVGWQTTVGLDEQAEYSTQLLLLNDVNKLLDKIIYFRYARSYHPVGENEEYGFLNSKDADVPFNARPQLAAVSNYNAIMADAEYKETLVYNGINFYSFRLSDGRSAIVTFAGRDNQGFGLSLDCESVTVCDMYGNEETVYGHDGNFSFQAQRDVLYIIGDFTSTTVAEPLIRLLNEDFCVLRNQGADAAVSGGKSVSYKMSSNVNVVDNKLTVSDFDAEKPWLEISVYENNKLYFKNTIYPVEKLSDDVIFQMNRGEWSGFHTWSLYQSGCDDRENAFCLGQEKGSSQARLYTDEFELEWGKKYILSFDIRPDSYRRFSVCIHGDPDNPDGYYVYAPGFYMHNDGYFTFHYGEGKWNAAEPETKLYYNLKQWYNVKCIIDTSKLTVKYFVDDVYIGEETENEYYSEAIKQLSFSLPDIGTNGVVYLDNITITEYPDIFGPYIKNRDGGYKAVVESNKLLGKQYRLVYAVYENGIFKEMAFKAIDWMDAFSGKLELDFDMPAGENISIKAFLFENNKNLKPVVPDIKLEKNNFYNFQ